MKINSSKSWRNGLGLSQIMATLLVVLPTLAFSVTMIIEYWAVMQADYRLKLVTNLTSNFLDSSGNLPRTISDTVGYTNYETAVNDLCPANTDIEFTQGVDNVKGEISVTVKYIHNGTYFKNKTITSKMHTYSLHDKNISVVATCK